MASLWVVVSGCAGPPPEPLWELRTWTAGHRELLLLADGGVRPLWLDATDEVRLCLEAPLDADPSQWEARLRLAGRRHGGFRPPLSHHGTQLCFGTRLARGLEANRGIEVCATLRDGLSGERHRLPCRLIAYRDDRAGQAAADQKMAALLGQRAEMQRDTRLREIDRLAADLESTGFPQRALQLRLVAIYEQRRRGTLESLADTRRRLDALPGWLDQPAAATYAAMADYEGAQLEIARGSLSRAWSLAAASEARFRSVADPVWGIAAFLQADILARLGAGAEAIERLQGLLETCTRQPCAPIVTPLAKDLLVWLLALDPDAGREALSQAARFARAQALPAEAAEAREAANRKINLAYLESRLGRDPTFSLAIARWLLLSREQDGRTRELLGWADVVDGLAALGAGRPEASTESCARALDRRPAAHLASWAWSCLGEAYRQRGMLQTSLAAFEQALVRHALASPGQAGKLLVLSTGRRADDYYRAARVAIELGKAERAWEILTALDRLAGDALAQCPEGLGEDSRRRQAQRQRLLERLAITAAPMTADQEQRLAPVRRQDLRALRELSRTGFGCREVVEVAATPADIRALALPDEVLHLERRDSEVKIRRTPWERQSLRRHLERLTAAQRDGVDDPTWRRLAAPLGAALAPNDQGPPRYTRFALHGLLQQVPLAALPVPAPGEPWLVELTTPVLRPAFVERRPRGQASGPPLFVVDPERNLPSGGAGRQLYRKIFPEARVLFGRQATLGAVRQALSRARSLHVDAHGLYYAALPELSGLRLADGILTLDDLEGLRLPGTFVNLSGCLTGRPVLSADSGRFGLAGGLARRGVPWVVASSREIEDLMAHAFNRAFYRQIRRTPEVPAAYAAALGAVREDFPASRWSSFILLGSGPEADPGGQIWRTPDSSSTEG